MLNSALKVVATGPFMFGKSTFIHALLGQEVLPARLKTTNILEIKYGETPRAIFSLCQKASSKCL